MLRSGFGCKKILKTTLKYPEDRSVDRYDRVHMELELDFRVFNNSVLISSVSSKSDSFIYVMIIVLSVTQGFSFMTVITFVIHQCLSS